MGIWNKAWKVGKEVFKKQKTTGTETVVPKIAKNLKGRLEAKQDIFKAVDKAAGPYVSSQKKSKIKIEAGKKVSKIFDKKRK